MITIIGTSHIAQQSIDLIKKCLDEKKIDCIAVELDLYRLNGLKNKDENKNNKNKQQSYFDKHNILQSIIIKLLMKLQNKLSKETGLEVGQEMLFAINEAEKRGIAVKLIDQHITATISKLNKISFREKIKFLFYLVFGLTALPFMLCISFGKKSFDLKKIPDKNQIKELMREFKKRFPETFKVLIDERNEIMAQKIKKIGKDYENILVVVGAGHVSGLKQILQNKINYNPDLK